MKKYIPRIADKLLIEALETSGAVLIEGAKWCGKTSTGLHCSCSHIYMQDPDKRQNYLNILASKPSLLLKGEAPRLIDEWQTAPVLWDAVRHAVDMRSGVGHFILTGSAVPQSEEDILHTGTGRISRFTMRPMSLYESNESNGSVSLKSLFNSNDTVEGISDMTIENLATIIVRGGWPAAVAQNYRRYDKVVRDYVEAVIHSDINRADGVVKDSQKVEKLLKSIARNTATEVKLSTIAKDIVQFDDEKISYPTIVSYIKALERIYVLENLSAWSPIIRSKTPLRSMPKYHFVDPSIATAVLGINQEKLLTDFNTFGYLFESLCIRDLRVYADAIDGKVFHYRDKSNLECDAIVVLRDGRWGAIEVKMGAGNFEEASTNLLKFVQRIDQDKMNKPSFLMILSATNYAYTRKDGIHVVPISCLKD